MALFAYIFLIGLFQLAQGEECKAPKELTSAYQLQKALFDCNYYEFTLKELPVVNVKFKLNYFSLDSNRGILQMHTWLKFSWKDERLKWDPDKYDGIKDTEVLGHRILMPSLRLYNSVDKFDISYIMYFAQCSLKNTGDISCVGRMPFEVSCGFKLANFPYDVQVCDLIFGSDNTQTNSFNIFNISVSSRAMNMVLAAYGSEWTITDYKQQTGQVPGKQLNMTLTFEREANGFAAVIVYPSLVLSSLSIACMFLDVRLKYVRLMFVAFSLYSHYFWLNELAETLPKESFEPPKVLLYYRGSFILTVIVLLVTFALNLMCTKETTPHRMIVFINKFVYGSNVRYMVFPRWDVSDGDRFNEDWTKFANSVNTICTIVIIVTYVGLYFAFMPQPQSLSQFDF